MGSEMCIRDRPMTVFHLCRSTVKDVDGACDAFSAASSDIIPVVKLISESDAAIEQKRREI